MARRFSQFYVNILLLSMFLQTGQIRCFRRLSRRKLSAEADDIRSILSSTLDAKPLQTIENNKKRDTSREDLAFEDAQAEDNVVPELKDTSVYDDDVDEDYLNQQRDFENSDHKRSVETELSLEKSENQADADTYEETDPHQVKDVARRDANNEDDYNEELNAEASASSELKPRSINSKSIGNLEKIDNVGAVNSELEFEQQIEDQIQQRIDAIKEDIKREIERKQQIREIEANNAKYDALELNREDDEIENQKSMDHGRTLDMSKRSLFSRDKDMSNEIDKLAQSVRPKRSDIEIDNERSISRNTGSDSELEKSSQQSELISKRSDINEADKIKDNKEESSSLVLPVKKRILEKRMTLVKKSDSRAGKRKERNSILIPERGHAEVKDELPGDLTLGSNLRIARSDPTNALEDSQSARSFVHQSKRYRRDMANEIENEGGTMQDSFLFPAREKPGCRTRRRSNRDRKKAQKHPLRSRSHRAIRESSMDNEELDEERDKRAMALDEDIALEYKESFGGLQADTGGALGRFKRIKRSSKNS